jgi:hypothetical protein
MADVTSAARRPTDDHSGHTRSGAPHACGSLLARQIDLICASQRDQRRTASAIQIGGSTRGCTALADHVLRPVADADALAVPCRTSGPCGWQPAQGHRRPQPRGATTLSGKQMTPPRPRRPGGSCSTTLVVAGVRGAICGQVVALDVHSSRPKRRSDDGQTILKAALEGYRLGSDLGNLVELRGFEPRTSCMPWEMRKFNCRPMPARYGPYRSSRTGHAWNDGQMTVKTILEQR